MTIDINKSLKAKNLGRGDRPRKVKGIILHDTAGSGTHNDTKYLANPGDGRNVSVDFTVERDGSIWQLNPRLDTDWCFHAGRATGFKGLLGPRVNIGTVGIEIVQKANLSLTPLYPKEQVKSVAQLCVWLCDKFALGKDAITTHADIIRDGSRSDPRSFPFDEFWAYFTGFAINNDTTLAQFVYHKVGIGDTLFSIAVKYSTKIETIKALNDINEASNLIKLGQNLLVKE